MARSSITQILRRTYQTIRIATQQTAAPADVHEILSDQAMVSRRQFLQGTLLAGTTLGLRPQWLADAASDARILVVGAGVAGLTVAYRLQQAGLMADLVDASQRVGGRLRSLRDWPGCPNPVELGGEFIDTRHTAVWALVEGLGLPMADLWQADSGLEAEVFFFKGQRVSHQAVIEAFIPLAEKITRDLAAMGDRPHYRTANTAAQNLDRLSLDAYLETVDIDPMIRDLVRVAYITEFGRDSGEQTCLNMLCLIGAEAGQWSTYGISDERWHVIGGNEQIPQALLQRLQKPVQTGTCLESLRDNGNGTYRVSLRRDGTSQERTYDGVVLAVPFSVLRQVDLEGVELPPAKQAAIAHLGYGTSTKLFVPLRERIWRTRYGSTVSVYTDQDFQNTWESVRYSPGSSGWITNLRGGQEGIRVGQGEPDVQGDRLIASLEPLFPGIQQVQRGPALRAYWATEPYALGSYSCYLPGQWTQFGGAEAEPVGRLWFAGEHCSLNSQGYINGAVESAEVATQQVLRSIGARLL